MTKVSYRVFLILTIIAMLGIIVHTTKMTAPGSASGQATVAEVKIDSLEKSIRHRDTIIVPRDTVIYRTKKIKEVIVEYVNTKDTIVKIAMCDSMAVRCDSISSQYSRNDSLFRQQVYEYQQIIVLKDTIINDQKNTIAKLSRRVKFVAAASATAAAVLTTILLK